MEISKELVEHVAKLSKLELSEAEKENFTREMANILQFMDKLNELDTKDIPTTAHVLPINNVFRDDVSEPSYPRDAILQNAPSKERGCFSVPKVVE